MKTRMCQKTFLHVTCNLTYLTVNNEDYIIFVTVFLRMKLVLKLPLYIRAVSINQYSSVTAISWTRENVRFDCPKIM